ncbi:MAG: hypothetical protein AAF637_01650 [Pseudomonadota bacterium]
MYRTLLAFATLFWLLVEPIASQAQTRPMQLKRCNAHNKLVEILRGSYAEVPSARGLQSNGHLIQVFVSKKSGSWTIVSTRPDGLSCVVATGRHWQDLTEPPREPVA